MSQATIVAKATGAEVKALFVADNSDAFFEVTLFDTQALMEGIVTLGRKVLAEAGGKLDAAGVRHTTQLVEKPVAPGQISSTIVAQADAWNADLIVLGTHGRRGVRRLLMGSVSEGVIGKTNRPVLLIRSEVEG